MLFKKLRQKKLLKKIEAFRELDGWLTDSEALGLFKMAASLGEKASIVEIGSWQGKSSYCLARGLKSGLLYAIDPFNGDAGEDLASKKEYEEKKEGRELEQVFIQNMNRLGVMEKIRVNKGYSKDFHNQFTEIDALFIDGDHSYAGCSNDFHLYAHKLIREGFLAFHDYYPERTELGPTRVIQELVMHDHRFTFYRQYDSLWIAKRIN